MAPVEVKLGEHRIDEAAESLLRLRNKVDTSRIGEPSFMMGLPVDDMPINVLMEYLLYRWVV